MTKRPRRAPARGGASPLEAVAAAYGSLGRKISMPKGKKPVGKGTKTTKSTKTEVSKQEPSNVKVIPAKPPVAPKKKTTDKKPGRAPKSEPITSGPNATHARDLDTGKAVKLDPAARKAVQSFYSRQMPSSTANQPAVDLTGPEFAPRPPKVPVKRSKK